MKSLNLALAVLSIVPNLFSAPAWAQTLTEAQRLEAVEQASDLESLIPNFTRGVDNPEAQTEGLYPVLERGYFRPQEQVLGYLHAEVEAETDVIYMVNTATRSNSCKSVQGLMIPHQHMIILKRNSQQQSIFARDAAGRIVGVNPQGASVVALPTMNPANPKIDVKQSPQILSLADLKTAQATPFIPVSTGIAGGQKIFTYSGIFRVNEQRTNDKRKSTNTVRDPMQFSVYISGEYNDGGEARLALHGTSEKYWGLLGEQRASSGCIRLQSNFSEWNQQFLFDKSSTGHLIPKAELTGPVRVWSRRDHFPPASQNFSQLPKAQKLRVLVIFFDGTGMGCG